MLNIKPFRALHPTGKYVEKANISHGVSGDKKKAAKILAVNPYSMLHVTHADIELQMNAKSDSDDNNSLSHNNALAESSKHITEEAIRAKTREAMDEFLAHGIFVQDETENLYISRLTYNGHTQTGLIACSDAKDYIEGRIKKHELTRAVRVNVQVQQIERIGGNVEPIFLVCDSDDWSGKIIDDYADTHTEETSFVDDNGVCHKIWTISDPEIIEKVRQDFAKVDSLYICDGHHRIAASAQYWETHRKSPEDEEGRYFMSIIFPSHQMNIIDYNRAVTDTGDMTVEEFMNALEAADFSIEELGAHPFRPTKPGEFGMCLCNTWYKLNYIGNRPTENPVCGLDVSILQNRVIANIFGITDPSHDERLAFVSGTKGMDALLEAAGDHGVAFALYPVSMEEIMSVADAGMTMPPKSTRFEPKPAVGVLIYRI